MHFVWLVGSVVYLEVLKKRGRERKEGREREKERFITPDGELLLGHRRNSLERNAHVYGFVIEADPLWWPVEVHWVD